MSKKKHTGGKPSITDEQYRTWLDAMRPHLLLACTLHRACELAGLSTHYVTMTKKYNDDGWFTDIVDRWRQAPAETVNEVFSRLANQASDKVKNQEKLTREELDALKFYAEKHRSSQVFFVTRNETADVTDKPVGKILDSLEQTDYGKLGSEARKQMVETNPPVQNKEQGGKPGDVQAEPDPAKASS